MLLLFFTKYAALLLLLLITAAGAGTLALGGREGIAIRSAVGLALFGQACFLLAAGGQLRALPLTALTIVAVVGGAFRFHRLDWPKVPGVVACVLVIMPLFVLALYPPLAFDETLYHLPFVRALAHDGALRFLPALRFPVFPQIHELISVPLFLTGSDVATHLVALAEVVITAALLIEWGKRYGVRAGWLAAAFFLGSPLVIHLATITYVDAALTLFVAAGLYALDRERFLLAGYFLGTACSVKYLGWYFVVAAMGIVLVRTAGRRRDAVRFILACAAAAIPTTLWIVLTTHEPLFPFLGTTLWALPATPLVSLGERSVGFLRVIWDVTFARARMDQQPPMTSLLIGMVAVIAIAAIRHERARWVLAISAGYLIVFGFLPQDARYLVPLLPLVCVTAAVAVASRWAKATTLLALLSIAPGIAYAGYRMALLGIPPATPPARREWLARHVPAYSAVARAGNERIYVCGGEQLKDYAGGELLGDFAGPYSYQRILAGADDTATLAQRLRKIDAQYFLVVKSACSAPPANGGMVLAYEDAAAQLWRVQTHSAR